MDGIDDRKANHFSHLPKIIALGEEWREANKRLQRLTTSTVPQYPGAGPKEFEDWLARFEERKSITVHFGAPKSPKLTLDGICDAARKRIEKATGYAVVPFNLALGELCQLIARYDAAQALEERAAGKRVKTLLKYYALMTSNLINKKSQTGATLLQLAKQALLGTAAQGTDATPVVKARGKTYDAGVVIAHLEYRFAAADNLDKSISKNMASLGIKAARQRGLEEFAFENIDGAILAQMRYRGRMTDEIQFRHKLEKENKAKTKLEKGDEAACRPKKLITDFYSVAALSDTEAVVQEQRRMAALRIAGQPTSGTSRQKTLHEFLGLRTPGRQASSKRSKGEQRTRRKRAGDSAAQVNSRSQE